MSTPNDLDARVEERQTALRRPEISIAPDAAYVKTLRRWTDLNMKEVRRQTKFIRREMFRFLKDHHRIEHGDQDGVERMLVSACEGVTRDVALYCLMLSTGPFRNLEEVGDGKAAYLVYFSTYQLGMQMDVADALWLLERYRCKTSLSQVITKHLARAMTGIIEVMDLADAVDEMPGSVDPSVRYHLQCAIHLAIVEGRDEFKRKIDAREKQEISDRWTTGIQFSALMKLYPPRELPTLIETHPQEYVDEVRDSLERRSNSGSNTLDGMVSHLLSGRLDAPFVLRPNQLVFIKRLLDAPARIGAYERWHARAERLDSEAPWSTCREDLARERGVLSSIVDDSVVRSALVEKLLSLQLDSDTLVAVTASIRNRIYEGNLSEDGEFDAEYKNALGEHAGHLKEPQERDPAVRGLFALDVDKEKRDADFDAFFEKGFY